MIDLLVSILRSGTPLVYAAMAGMLAQRAGIWNLGLEGLIIIGACASVVGTIETGSLAAGIGIAVAASVAASILLWLVIEQLRANPIIAGLGLTGFGLGGTSLTIQSLYGSEAAVHSDAGLPRLGDAFGAFGVLSILVALMPVIVIALWVLVRRTRFGLQLTAVGEHPFAARSVGVNPSRMRFIALAGGGVLCALSGAELSLGSLQFFSVNMTAGRGFMAFAAVIFGAGDPIGVTLAALFFSAVDVIGIKAQLALGGVIPQNLVLSLPYVATVFGVWLSSRRRRSAKASFSELRDY